MTPVRVLLVDDQALIRQGLRKLLDLEEAIDVVADAADGVEALDVLDALDGADVLGLADPGQPAAAPEPPGPGRARRPVDVALVDARMPRMDGVDLIRRLSADRPTIACLVLSTFDEDEYVLGALRAGARGYLLKDCSPDELVQAVHAARAGQTVLAGPAADRVVASLNAPGGAPTSGTSFPGADLLSTRELDVVAMIVAGRTNREIAAALHLTEGTVKNHVSSTLRKLALRDRVQLALHASRGSGA